jgi:uncharacterized protein YutE (UPF0331/DUF86 family)
MIQTHLTRASVAHKHFMTSATSKNFNDLAMECFQAVNYSIALMERIVESNKGESAMTYAELVDALEKLSVIKRAEADKLRRLIRLRNLIAHEYFTINPDELRTMYKLLPTVRALFR